MLFLLPRAVTGNDPGCEATIPQVDFCDPSWHLHLHGNSDRQNQAHITPASQQVATVLFVYIISFILNMQNIMQEMCAQAMLLCTHTHYGSPSSRIIQ